jgi:hypothetical protein
MNSSLTLRTCLITAALALPACTTLLPNSTTETRTPWTTYADAEAMYSRVVTNKTTVAELHALGVDPSRTPNVALLSNADVLRRVAANGAVDVRMFDQGLQACLTKRVDCVGYEVEQTTTQKKRVGNFFTDFLTFDQQTDISGWQFKAIFVVQDGVVIYKLWSGKPQIQEFERQVRPLGPLQNLGARLH